MELYNRPIFNRYPIHAFYASKNISTAIFRGHQPVTQCADWAKVFFFILEEMEDVRFNYCGNFIRNMSISYP
jgi:hypothetical protein